MKLKPKHAEPFDERCSIEKEFGINKLHDLLDNYVNQRIEYNFDTVRKIIADIDNALTCNDCEYNHDNISIKKAKRAAKEAAEANEYLRTYIDLLRPLREYFETMIKENTDEELTAHAKTAMLIIDTIKTIEAELSKNDKLIKEKINYLKNFDRSRKARYVVDTYAGGGDSDDDGGSNGGAALTCGHGDYGGKK